MEKDTFAEWLKKEMQARDLNNVGLGLKLGLSDTTIGYWIRGARRPDTESCLKIAHVFNIPEQEILIRAGYLSEPIGPITDLRERHALHLFSQLPSWRKDEALSMLRLMVESVPSISHQPEPADLHTEEEDLDAEIEIFLEEVNIPQLVLLFSDARQHLSLIALRALLINARLLIEAQRSGGNFIELHQHLAQLFGT